MSNLETKINLLVAHALAHSAEDREAILQKLAEVNCAAVTDHLADVDVRTVVEHELISLGVSCNLNGFYHLTEAVIMLVNDPSLRGHITVVVYPEVAKCCKSTPTRVERCIRHAVSTIFDRCDWDTLEKYFGRSYSPNRGVMTNSEFICSMAHIVKRKMEDGYEVD